MSELREHEAAPVAEEAPTVAAGRPASVDPRAMRVLALQRQAGNRATAQVVARDYENERGNSTLADAPVELWFDGRTLSMGGQDVDLSWKAVSGKPQDGAFDYSVERQKLKGTGPIPEGVYWIDPRQLVDLRDKWLYSRSYARPWGSHRITIHPFTTTETYGRGGFFIHGGSEPGSAGCIDLTDQITDFATKLQRYIPADGGQPVKIKLHVSYPRAGVPVPEEAPLPAGTAIG